MHQGALLGAARRKAAAAAAQGCGRALAYTAGTSPLARSPESASPRSVSRANTDDGTDAASPRSGSVAISMEEPEAGPAVTADGEAPRDTRLQMEPPVASDGVERPPCGANITEATAETPSGSGMT